VSARNALVRDGGVRAELARLQKQWRLSIFGCQNRRPSCDKFPNDFGMGYQDVNRSGDLVAVAILQTLSDKQMASPEILKMVLVILRDAFGCPNRCVATTSDRQPRVTSLLLDHLYESSIGKLRDDDETKRLVTKQTVGAEEQSETENR
jgi:hypothetical protein